jgi:hypothetical protein
METEVREHHGRICLLPSLPKFFQHRMLNTFVCFKCRRSYTHGLLIRAKETAQVNDWASTAWTAASSTTRHWTLGTLNTIAQSVLWPGYGLGRPRFHSRQCKIFLSSTAFRPARIITFIPLFLIFEALCYQAEGRGFETRWGELLSL